VARRSNRLLALLLFTACARAAPFDTVDQNPLLGGFHVPTPVSARFDTARRSAIRTTLNWSNTAAIENRGVESLTLDAERQDWQLTYERTLSPTFAIKVQVPYRIVSGGVLDDFVDEWHALFGMPDGNRPQLTNNSLDIALRRNAVDVYARDRSYSELGDLVVAAGYQLTANATAATSVWWHVKLPIGSSDLLTSSGAVDSSLTLAHERELSSRWTTHVQANATYLGKGDYFAGQQRSWLWSATAAFDYRYSENLSAMVQLDGHTAAVDDTVINILGPAWILTVGGEYRWRSGWRTQFGVGEDVKVGASPDVTFVVTVGRSWK